MCDIATLPVGTADRAESPEGQLPESPERQLPETPEGQIEQAPEGQLAGAAVSAALSVEWIQQIESVIRTQKSQLR